MVPLVDSVDSGQWRKTVDPYMAETRCCWEGRGMASCSCGRGMSAAVGGGGGGRAGASVLTTSWTVLLAIPTAFFAEHS